MIPLAAEVLNSLQATVPDLCVNTCVYACVCFSFRRRQHSADNLDLSP